MSVRQIARFAGLSPSAVSPALHQSPKIPLATRHRVLRLARRPGYRRPGLVFGRYEDIRSAHAHVCVYLGWCQFVISAPTAVLVLQLDRAEEEPFVRWFETNEPAVIVFEWCGEMIISRIFSRDSARPTYPRIEMVERTWIEGGSLGRVKTRASAHGQRPPTVPSSGLRGPIG